MQSVAFLVTVAIRMDAVCLHVVTTYGLAQQVV